MPPSYTKSAWKGSPIDLCREWNSSHTYKLQNFEIWHHNTSWNPGFAKVIDCCTGELWHKFRMVGLLLLSTYICIVIIPKSCNNNTAPFRWTKFCSVV